MKPALLLLAFVSTFFISACGGGGSTASTPAATVPSAPVGVTAAIGDTQIRLSWAAVSGATSYNVYYRTTAGVTAANGTKITGATSGGAITGLINGTTYYFVVTAVNAAGESAVSSEVNAIPQIPTPGAPTGVGATAGNAQVKISWAAVPGAVSYNVYYRTTPGVTAANGTKESFAASGSPITGLANGTTYYFVVTAVSAGGESAVSSEVNATPQIPPGVWTTKAPMVYQRDNAANAVLNGIIYVMGGAPAGVGVLDSMEAYDPATDSWTTKAPMPAWSAIPSVPSWAPPGTLAAPPAYRYGPAAAAVNGVIYLIGGTSMVNGQGPIYPIAVYDPTINAAGGGTWSSTVPTTALTSAAGTNGQTLAPFPTGRWGFDVAVVDGIIYAVGGAIQSPTGVPKAWQPDIVGATSPAIISPLTSGKAYCFVVTSGTSPNDSNLSNEVCAVPQLVSASVPTRLVAVAGDGQVTLSWTAPSVAPTSYNVYYSTARLVTGLTTSNVVSLSGAAVTTLNVAGISTTITGLANGTTYYFMITAVNGTESAASTEVASTPRAALAGAPTGLTATAGDTQAILSWAGGATYNIYYGTGFNVYYGTVEAYDPVANTWTTKATMPTPRWGSTVSVVNGLIYAIGGWGGWPELSVVEVYDPMSNTWSTSVPSTAATIAAGTVGAPLAPMPTARDDFGFSVVNGVIYAIGGDTNTFNDYARTNCCTTVVEAYDPVKSTWTTKTAMPTIRDDFDASTVDGVIYAIAGSRDGKFTANPTPPPGMPPASPLDPVWLAANDGGFSLTTVEAFSTSSIPVPGGVAAAAVANQASISWNAVAGATSYNIYWSNKAGVSTTANSTKISNVTSPYTHPALTAGTWHYYVVTAVTALGESLPSGEVAVKP